MSVIQNKSRLTNKIKHFIKVKWVDGDCRHICLFCSHWKECRYDLGFPTKYDIGLERGYDIGYKDGMNDAKK